MGGDGIRSAIRNESTGSTGNGKESRSKEKDNKEKGDQQKKVIGVIASGPSLMREDCETLRRICDEVIAINDSYKLCPDAEHLYACDFRWWKHHIADVARDFDGHLWTANYGPGIGSNWCEKDKRPEAWGIECLEVDVDGTGICTKPGKINGGRNSGFQAINLAYHLGATETILIGYDWGHTNGKAHFFGDHPKELNRGCGNQFEAWGAYMERIDQTRHRILNASRVTNLHAFPWVSLEELEPGE